MPAAARAERSLQPPPPPVTSLRTLVLNADYRPLTHWPLSLIQAQDAISALWRERADVVEAWPGAFFRSPSARIEVPKVMALRQYARVRARPKQTRLNIFLRDHYTCQYCGREFASRDLTYDHVMPRSRGGETHWNNIVTACIPCNGTKGDRLPVGRFAPARPPRAPSSAELLLAGLKYLPDDIQQDFGSWLYWHTELEP